MGDDEPKYKLLEVISPEYKDVYNSIFDQVKREDELLNNRLGWLLNSQTILFGALALSSDSLVKNILLVIPFVGISIAIIILISNIGNSAIMWMLKKDFETLREDSYKARLPPPFGGFGIKRSKIRKYYKTKILGNILSPGIALPITFVIAWIVVLVILIKF